MNTEVFLAVLAVAGTLAAGLGGVALQARVEERKWLRERRAALYVELMAEAVQRRGLVLDRGPREWEVKTWRELIVLQAHVELFAEPQMRDAWRAYVEASEPRNDSADQARAVDRILATSEAVLRAGRRYGGNA